MNESAITMPNPATITLAMFWPVLMLAAGDEHNPNAVEAWARVRKARENKGLDPDAEVYREDLAEEMAREHFSMMAVERTDDGSYSGNEAPLLPTEPHHVALVLRLLALSLGIRLFTEPPRLEVKPNQIQVGDGGEQTRGVRLTLFPSRPWMREPGEAVGAGFFFPTEEPGTDADVPALIWRWFEDRYAEVNFRLDQEEEDRASEET